MLLEEMTTEKMQTTWQVIIHFLFNIQTGYCQWYQEQSFNLQSVWTYANNINLKKVLQKIKILND